MPGTNNSQAPVCKNGGGEMNHFYATKIGLSPLYPPWYTVCLFLIVKEICFSFQKQSVQQHGFACQSWRVVPTTKDNQYLGHIFNNIL